MRRSVSSACAVVIISGPSARDQLSGAGERLDPALDRIDADGQPGVERGLIDVGLRERRLALLEMAERRGDGVRGGHLQPVPSGPSARGR